MSSRCRTLQRAPTRVACNIEEGGPDYDWEARMEGKPSGDGDDEANHFFVVGNAWLVDNRQGLLTTEKHGDDSNIAANRQAKLLPFEITKLWSDQLSGVTDANYLPNESGQADRAYLPMGACQSNNFDLKGHLIAKVNVGGSPELWNKILWRLAGKTDRLTFMKKVLRRIMLTAMK